MKSDIEIALENVPHRLLFLLDWWSADYYSWDEKHALLHAAMLFCDNPDPYLEVTQEFIFLKGIIDRKRVMDFEQRHAA